jgi:hypothetical protein
MSWTSYYALNFLYENRHKKKPSQVADCGLHAVVLLQTITTSLSTKEGTKSESAQDTMVYSKVSGLSARSENCKW